VTSDITINHGDPCCLVSPRNCFRCGQPLLASATADSTDPSATDTDCDRTDEATSGTAEHPSRVVVSDPSLVSSRSSTPLDGFVPSRAALTGSDDECASLLSSDVGGGYASSDDLDSEYVSAMEVPEPQPGDVACGRESADSFNELDEADVFGSTRDYANEKFDVNSLDYDDDEEGNDDDENEDEDSLALNSTLMGGDALQESSNSASTLLEDPDETPRDSGHAAQSSSEDDSNDEDDDDGAYRDEMALLAEASDDADGEDNCLAPGNNPIEPLLTPAGDSDLSDAN